MFYGVNMLSSENDRIEYKERITNDLEKEVVAFLNSKEGGTIYIGISKDLDIVGINNCDEQQLHIKDRLIHNICPNILGLFDMCCEVIENKQVLKIVLASGSDKPYYIKNKGMSESGCFIRIGSASQPMDQHTIDSLYASRNIPSLARLPSPRQNLTFEQLRIYYSEKGHKLNEHFADSLDFYTPDGKYNFVAFLCADNNNMSFKVAKYSSLNRVELAENYEYGFSSIMKATNSILDKLNAENRVFARITNIKRIEVPMYDMRAIREAVVNAIIHNDYSQENPPKFELFPDRLEITSTGTLPFNLSKEDFFSGVSRPRNRELMRIFKDLEYVEHLGSGMERILNTYPKTVFQFLDNFIRIVIPFRNDEKVNIIANISEETREETRKETRKETREEILRQISVNPKITAKELASKIGLTSKGVEWHITKLKKSGKITRLGSTKAGIWKINK